VLAAVLSDETLLVVRVRNQRCVDVVLVVVIGIKIVLVTH
jgi:hypothetical protein